MHAIYFCYTDSHAALKLFQPLTEKKYEKSGCHRTRCHKLDNVRSKVRADYLKFKTLWALLFPRITQVAMFAFIHWSATHNLRCPSRIEAINIIVYINVVFSFMSTFSLLSTILLCYNSYRVIHRKETECWLRQSVYIWFSYYRFWNKILILDTLWVQFQSSTIKWTNCLHWPWS